MSLLGLGAVARAQLHSILTLSHSDTSGRERGGLLARRAPCRTLLGPADATDRVALFMLVAMPVRDYLSRDAR